MTHERDADAMYGAAPAPAAAPPASPQGPERAADAMYAPSPPTPPQVEESGRRVVAKADNAKTAAEIMYEDSPANAKPEEDGADDDVPVITERLQVTEKLSLTAPEGFSAWDQGALNTLGKLVETHDISYEEAQGLLDVHTKALRRHGEGVARSVVDEMVASHDERIAEWRRAIDSDPEIRDYGIANARQHTQGVFDNVMTKGFRQVLREYGLTNHPEFVKSMLNVRRFVTNRGRRGY